MPPDVDFARIYGPFAETTPPELQALMQGFERPWWIVGGWALDAFTGLERDHEDTDMSIFVDDVPAFRAHLEPRFHLWNNWGGTFRFFDADHPEPIHPLSQIWVREHAGAPWVVDCILTPSVAGKWQSKRDREHIAELDEVTWIDSRGIRYLRPEIVLFFKAARERSKDVLDYERTLPLLSDSQRAWLDDALERRQRGQI
ncbi:MAG: hypothetical protein FIB00_11240 [Chloroflexi bacterium]|nr:hypothetical protein [Chloroflexota bacterium]PWB45164.1 MAG: hypothetical protein C3F10_08180 [Dehalococcoidia bacterium]